jgi:hypothetical protein
MQNSQARPHIHSDDSCSENSTASETHPSQRYKANTEGPDSTASAETPIEEREYQPLFANIARVMCTDGADVPRLALAFQVDESTIRKWALTHKEFADAGRCGMNFADNSIQRSLYQLARGYDYRDVKIFHHRGEIIYAPYIKHVMASVPACIFWLVNRCPDEWGYLVRATKK